MTFYKIIKQEGRILLHHFENACSRFSYSFCEHLWGICSGNTTDIKGPFDHLGVVRDIVKCFLLPVNPTLATGWTYSLFIVSDTYSAQELLKELLIQKSMGWFFFYQGIRLKCNQAEWSKYLSFFHYTL